MNNDGVTPFFMACQNGHAGTVLKLLADERIHFNRSISDGRTPLYMACQNGHAGVISMLLGDGRINFNQSEDEGRTPLFISCQNGHTGVISMLLAEGRVDFNKSANDGRTPLSVACQKGHTGVVSLLLAGRQIDLNKSGNDGRTPLHIACQLGHMGIISMLVGDQRIDLNKPANDGTSPFYIACYQGRVNVVSMLLTYQRIDVNKARNNGATPLWIASSYGQLGVVQHLLASGREIHTKTTTTFNNVTAAAQAKMRGSMTVKQEADSTEVFQRCKANCPKIADLIEAFEKDPRTLRSQLRKQLGMIVLADDAKEMKINEKLPKDPAANVNAQDGNGYTALAVACWDGKVETVKFLLGIQGVQVNTPERLGCTPFYLACQKGHLGIVSLLLSDKRVDVNKPMDGGVTPFYRVCQQGQADVVLLLLADKRVDANKSASDATPLWIASYNGHLTVVQHLLASGREIDTKKIFNNTTAAGTARLMGSRAAKFQDESDEVFHRCKANGPKIADLIESFEKYPATTRSQLKKQLETAGNFLSPGSPEAASSAVPSNFGGKIQIGKNEDFFRAAKDGDLSAVQRLSSDPNININWQNNDGATPLAAACQEGKTEIVRFLLGLQNLLVNLPLKTGLTPFFIACHQSNVAVISLLLADKRVDVNKPSSDGASPFCAAWFRRDANVVVLLLSDHRVDINQASNDGATPFFMACQDGHVEGVHLLLSDKRLDVNKSTSNGITPLWLASQNGHLAAVQLILASGRDVDTKKVSTYNNLTAAENARFMGSRTVKPEGESDQDFQRKQVDGPKIAALIESFEKYPATIRSQLKKQLGMSGPMSPSSPVTPNTSNQEDEDLSRAIALSLQDLKTASPTVVSPKKIAVEYNGSKQALHVPLSSMDNLVTSLKNQLSITTGISVEYYDADLEDFMALKNVKDLPANVVKIKVIAESIHWWGWSPDASWIKKGLKINQYFSLLVKEGTTIHHAGVLSKFTAAAQSLGFHPDQIHKIFAISNPKLLSIFENYRDTLHGKHRANPRLFKKNDWENLPDAKRRQRHLASLFTEITKWEWNDGAHPAVLPMIQGTAEEAVWQICQHGFGVTATTDSGYYGQGMYFTSKLNYAKLYAKNSENRKVFLLAAVIPGNVFPVTEHPFLPDKRKNPQGYLGKPCRPGYQSHHALVDEKVPEAEVSDENEAFVKLADELVVFDVAQTIPLFVFYGQ